MYSVYRTVRQIAKWEVVVCGSVILRWLSVSGAISAVIDMHKLVSGFFLSGSTKFVHLAFQGLLGLFFVENEFRIFSINDVSETT